MDATGLGLWEWNVRTGELTWNARNRELFGIGHADALSIGDYPELVHPDDRDLVRSAYRTASERPDDADFSVEHRCRPGPDGKSRWVLSRGRVMKDAEGVRLVVGSNLDITDRKTAEARRSVLLRELGHRAKNGIVVLMTIVTQTAKSAKSVKDFEDLLLARLTALAESQDLVTHTEGRSLRVGDLIDRALKPFDTSRFDIDARLRDAPLASESAVAMALLLHELSTNAVKYGALSSRAGRVTLAFDVAEGQARLRWVETGGPPVTPPNRRGFGSRLLEIALRNDGGRVTPRFAPDGFEADIHFPLAAP